MKKSKVIVGILSLHLISGFSVRTLVAQGYGGELAFQGVDHYSLHSAAGRAMAGVSFGVTQDPGLMF